ncbi:Proteasome activator BLM10 [Lecanora helva]
MGPRNPQDPEEDLSKVTRSRPRKFPYLRYLPYEIESEAKRHEDFKEILKQLYIAVESGDLSVGAAHWTRELRNWLGLKFDPTKEERIRLVKLYYELALAPGVDINVADRFSSTFMVLIKKKHYLRPGIDLTLDWRPLFREWKVFVIPSDTGMVHTSGVKRSYRTLARLCSFAQLYFDPHEIPAMLEEILPYFSTSFIEGAFVVTGLLNLLFPTAPPPDGEAELLPQHYLATFFHIWSLVNRSKVFDGAFLDLFSRLARDALTAPQVPFSEYGIFTKEQSSSLFTAILRLLEIPVGQAASPYSGVVDLNAGLGAMLQRDQKKHPASHHIARWIVMSLSPASLDKPDSIMSNFEGLIQAVETFFHPSNAGAWTKHLSQLVYYLTDLFLMRYNREKSGELQLPDERKINDALRRRFVLCLREVVFMGIYAKSHTAMNFSLSSLQALAYLEPELILPGALQRIYPSLQGLVEVHRTTSSLRALQVLSRAMVLNKGFRCHVTTMLGLTLPGIDANDLDKTLYTLTHIQCLCNLIPFHDLTIGRQDVSGSVLAMDWISSEVARMEEQGVNVQLDYKDSLSDADEELILRSSTAGLAEFLSAFLGKVFTLLENLPDASRPRSGSPEENIVNTLPCAFLPLLGSLSPDLYDLALNKIADFIGSHVIHQARDAMAFICNCLCKINPSKALKRLVPVLIQSIRTEIDENAAASTRNTGTDVLPRDRGLLWAISMLSMSVVHVGDAVLEHRQELFDIAAYMQQNCIGLLTMHIANFIHHLLLNLTGTYTTDYSLYEADVYARGLGPDDWGKSPDAQDLHIKWHVPSQEELQFAVDLLKDQGNSALQQLENLTSGDSSTKHHGVGKGWSDEVSRNLELLQLLLSGVSVLFDPRHEPEVDINGQGNKEDIEMVDINNDLPQIPRNGENDANLSLQDEDEVKPTFIYPTGYSLKRGGALYHDVHAFRERAGQILHLVHSSLMKSHEDDVNCFEALCLAYKSWFVDVGMERSAHVLDRLSKLYDSDCAPYKITGTRKEYPRPLLLRRALVYHVQRLRHNSYPRPQSNLSRQLFTDLATSSISAYRDVRRHAQSAGEAALKAIIESHSVVIPLVLTAFERGVQENEFPRIKGGMYSLLFGSLTKTIGRDWRYAPRLIKSFIQASTADKLSIQKLCATAVMTIMELARPLERAAIIDKRIILSIAPEENVESIISTRKAMFVTKRGAIEDRKAALSDELVDQARNSHWKQASRTAAIVLTMGVRFERIASDNLIDLVTKGSINAHPNLRGLYSGAFIAVCSIIESRATASHSYENYLLNKQNFPSKIEVPTRQDDTSWTSEFLSKFTQPEAEYYIDHDHPGWFVWAKTMPARVVNPKISLEYDATENEVRSKIGKLLDRDWYSAFFAFLRQEPRDATADRFRMTSAMMLGYTFDLMQSGLTVATFSDVQSLITELWTENPDKHQHRAMAEILGALLGSTEDKSMESCAGLREYVFPIVQQVFSDGLNPENVTYWTTFLHLATVGKDPRRIWPLINWLASFRLDMDSNAAFKESSKIHLVRQSVHDLGWHFQLEKPILENFLQHLDHPYKGVREAMGAALATIYRTRYHESYSDVGDLVRSQSRNSSLGVKPYQPSAEFVSTIHEVFERLEKWRHERTPGQQTPSSYTSGGKTVLLWLDMTIASHECTELQQFIPHLLIEQLLYMMDVKEDQELQALAYHVFRDLANVPHRLGEDAPMIEAFIRIGTTSPFWHQRLRVLINIQVIYFRRLFQISRDHQEALLTCVANMLEDSQLEVRLGASATLSGMIRCSPEGPRVQMIEKFNKTFTKMLIDSPLPKKARNGGSNPGTGTSTPTPEHNKLAISRHAAVLGLGALVQAFPYKSPPPTWIPGVLTTLANKANNDPGMVGKSVKSILSDFKKTRQDTWQMDLKAFSQEQAEDLDGVLWKSYFA